MKNLVWNILSMLASTVVWVLWYLAMRYIMPHLFTWHWLALLLIILPAGVAAGAFVERVAGMMTIYSLYKTAPSIAPVYWNLVPALTVGLYVIAIPLWLGFQLRAAMGPLPGSVWLVLGEFTLFPFLYLMTALTTPRSVRRSMSDGLYDI